MLKNVLSYNKGFILDFGLKMKECCFKMREVMLLKVNLDDDGVK